MSQSNDVQVSVLMICYNHERYLSQAIESVLSQQTSFPFEVLIYDDKSTDAFSRFDFSISGTASRHH